MQKKTRKQLMIMIMMAVLLVVISIFSILVGSADIGLADLASLFRGTENDFAYNIIISIRFPRVAAAIILGGALSVSGFLLQIFFGNPIAGPYVLGVSSSAKLFVALVMVFLLENGRMISSFGMIVAAFTGSLISMGIVLLLANRIRNMSLLVVCGVMIGYICSAITDFIVCFAEDSNIVNLHNWSLGSFSGTTMEHVQISLVFVAGCLIVAFMLSKPIGAYQLGEAYARNMGVDIRALRILLILVSSLLSATVTAFAGPISFVGIAVPHIIRGLLKTAKPMIMIPACFIGGSIITLVCDDIARTAFAPTELSISSVTAIGLAPIVIYLLIRRGERSWKK